MTTPEEQDAPPPWQPDDLPGSLERYATWLNDKARRTFLADKTHVEIFFLLTADGQAGIGAPPKDMPRDAVAAAIKDSIKANDIYGVIHIAEAWTYFPKKPRDHTFTQVAQGEIAVSQLKPEDRSEALTVHMESRDGASRLWISPILRNGPAVALADPIDWRDPPKGRFGGLFHT